jgi:hypothetical protein
MKPDSKFTSFSNLFVFTWSLEIQFDSFKFQNLFSFSGKLGEIVWNDDELKLKEKQKEQLENSFSELYSQPFHLFGEERISKIIQPKVENKCILC